MGANYLDYFFTILPIILVVLLLYSVVSSFQSLFRAGGADRVGDGCGRDDLRARGVVAHGPQHGRFRRGNIHPLSMWVS